MFVLRFLSYKIRIESAGRSNGTFKAVIMGSSTFRTFPVVVDVVGVQCNFSLSVSNSVERKRSGVKFSREHVVPSKTKLQFYVFNSNKAELCQSGFLQYFLTQSMMLNRHQY